MIIVVGHGPSAKRACRRFIDQHTVIRLGKPDLDRVKELEKFVGTKTDIVCSSQIKYRVPDAGFWEFRNEPGGRMKFCINKLKPFKPRFEKPSTGLCAVILARHNYPNEDIGVTGFDYTLYPEEDQVDAYGNLWRHDQFAENRCIKTLGVIDLFT